MVDSPLIEADVRRIVREEIEAAFKAFADIIEKSGKRVFTHEESQQLLDEYNKRLKKSNKP